MNYQKIGTISLLLFFISGICNAQIVVDGEFRVRTNVENAYKMPALAAKNSDVFVDQRSRIRMNYSNEKYEMRFTLQDARIWGGDKHYNKVGMMGNSDAIDLFEAWAQININEKSSLRIGRQQWNYYDMRLLASRNWWTSGMSYDGLLYQYKNTDKQWTLDLGLSYNNEGAKNGIVDNSAWDGTKLKTLNFITINKSFSAYTNLAWLSTISGRQASASASLLATATHGLLFSHNINPKKNTEGWFGIASAYYQHGSDNVIGSDGHYRSISAYMLNASIGMRIKKLELSLGMEHLSGRDYTNTDGDYNNTRHSFDLLNGGRFPYYGGNLNHFIIQDSYLMGTKGGAFSDYYIKAKYKFSKKSILELAFHLPQLSSDVKAHLSIDPTTKKPIGVDTDTNGKALYWKGDLGQYIDLTHTYKVNKEIILKSGFSYGQISDLKNQLAYGYADANTKQLNELATNYYGWVMLIIKPTFFQTK